MLEMRFEPSLVENVATKDYALRILRERALDHRPKNGNKKAIGPPISNSGSVAGHKNTRRGYFLVIQTESTPLSTNSLIDDCSSSLVGVLDGALVL